jgi:hypothetical protein
MRQSICSLVRYLDNRESFVEIMKSEVMLMMTENEKVCVCVCGGGRYVRACVRACVHE